MATRGQPVSVRLDPEVRKALEAAAKADDRSLSSLINRILRDYLRKAGYLKP
jgi:hypothetical protein